MAVTLTSTGITFSDGSTQNSAATGGVYGAQTFNTSGTWSHAGSGSPSNVVVSLVGGGGGATNRTSNYSNNAFAKGGIGGFAVNAPVATSGNKTVTVGAQGNNSYSAANAGGASNFGGSVQANGGGGGSYHYESENWVNTAGSSGNVTGGSLAAQGSNNAPKGRGGNTYGSDGLPGAVVVVW
jgi:hypothetical protein